MIKTINTLLIFLPLLAFIACEEDFNPNADFIERNVLTSLLRSDTSYQVLYLSRSYEIDGTDATQHNVDPSIKGADVKMWHNGKVYPFSEGTLDRIDNSRYDTPVNFYYNDSLELKAGEQIEVEALLPNGLLLTSSINVPNSNEIKIRRTEDVIAADTAGENLLFSWSTSGDQNIVYLPILSIKYFNRFTGTGKLLGKAVPLEIQEVNGQITQIFTTPSNNTSIAYNQSEFDVAMSEIANEETFEDLDDISVIAAELKLYIFDENLSAYYASVGTFQDGFTIKVDQADYSNVDGGFGIYGAFSVKTLPAPIDRAYINSYGYR